MAIMEVKNLSVIYHASGKRVAAVSDVSLTIEERDAIGIVGESGSGKSTLAMAILRLLPERIAQAQGEVSFEGADLLTLPAEKLNQLRWKQLAVVFQKSMNALSPVHKIGMQMTDVYRIKETGISKRETRSKMLQLLDMVNLPERVYDLYPHELSGGMMQRVAIALSLMHNPKLLILDEATTALDVVTQGQILEEMVALEQKLGITRMMITHDMSVVASSCNKVAVMYAGRILETGLVKDVLANPVHPYTKGLLKSIPSFTGEKRNIRGIPGSIPDLSVPNDGCIFAERCEHAMDSCLIEKPQDMVLPGNHRVACHLAGGAAYVS
ncbi:peptide/nickel transport system ATP-binding protein [Paenibacillus algorifonticola]|uniref:Nickel import system ATP-binding protein NikD n=1 Tax=Paenibacillus algorifonticola TaxID=684063 RepID=A0A1I2IWA4_9BACL|nr:ABC transporter ATP-binding protein [Paenibacillus algorifonticola]SFF46685.1 peptide/nickel transport system ATP-binding protein [Paenibacillus algorifonticola]